MPDAFAAEPLLTRFLYYMWAGSVKTGTGIDVRVAYEMHRVSRDKGDVTVHAPFFVEPFLTVSSEFADSAGPPPKTAKAAAVKINERSASLYDCIVRRRHMANERLSIRAFADALPGCITHAAERYRSWWW